MGRNMYRNRAKECNKRSFSKTLEGFMLLQNYINDFQNYNYNYIFIDNQNEKHYQNFKVFYIKLEF